MEEVSDHTVVASLSTPCNRESTGRGAACREQEYMVLHPGLPHQLDRQQGDSHPNCFLLCSTDTMVVAS